MDQALGSRQLQRTDLFAKVNPRLHHRRIFVAEIDVGLQQLGIFEEIKPTWHAQLTETLLVMNSK